MIVTDLSRFGFRELYEVEKLLEAMRTQGLPHDFYRTGVCPAWNNESGYVFLTNDEYQVCLLNKDKPYLDSHKLESWYSCPNCGFEGFFDEDFETHSEDERCLEYVEDLRRSRDGNS